MGLLGARRFGQSASRTEPDEIEKSDIGIKLPSR